MSPANKQTTNSISFILAFLLLLSKQLVLTGCVVNAVNFTITVAFVGTSTGYCLGQVPKVLFFHVVLGSEKQPFSLPDVKQVVKQGAYVKVTVSFR